MTTTYTKYLYNWFTGILKKKKEPEWIHKNSIAGEVSALIMEIILQYDLEVVNCDTYFVHYRNDNGLNIKVYETTPKVYELEVNRETHYYVEAEHLLDFIEFELMVP